LDIIDEVDEQDLKSLQDQVERAQKAKALLDDPIVAEFIKDNQNKLFDILDTIPLNDKEARMRVNDMIWTFRKFEKSLKEHVEFGEIAYSKWKELLEMKKTLMERIF